MQSSSIEGMEGINGSYHQGYEDVAQAFKTGMQAREMGAALAVFHLGEPVIDLWAGYTDRKATTPWQADTLVCCYSISKAITATCVLQAVDQGLIDLDSPVQRYWPEFANHNKADITVRQVLCHQAGLPGFHTPLDKDFYYRWDDVCTQLADEHTWWPPGTAHGYHARTFGFLAGEVLRRATGQPIEAWLNQHVADPLQAEFYFGLTEAQQQRCADMIPGKLRKDTDRPRTRAMEQMMADFNNLDTATGAAFSNPNMGPGYMNRAPFRQAVMPAVNGHGTARGVATIFAALPDLLSPELLQEAATTQAHGPDQVLKSTTRFGLGYMLYEPESPIGWPGCMGHAGAGGSIAFYDPERALSFAFVMNQMQEGVVTGGTTATACVQALEHLL